MIFCIPTLITGLIIGFICAFFYLRKIPITHKQNIQTLVRQTSRWSAAAKQDESPIIALLHANYGAGYLWALKDIATDAEIKQASNIDILPFEKKITDIQDASTRKVSRVCPKFTANIDKELLILGGDL